MKPHNSSRSPTKGTIPPLHHYYKRDAQGGFEFVRPALFAFNYVEAESAQIYPRHQHRNYELIFAQKGCYRCLLNDTVIELQPGDLLIIKCGDWHEDIYASRLRYLAVIFDLVEGKQESAGDILFSEDVKPEQQVIRGPNTEIWRLLDRMRAESDRRDHVVAHVENALVTLLFWLLVRAIPPERLAPVFLERSATRTFADRLLRMFRKHLAENVSIIAMAAELGVSLRTLTKRCREATGRSPANAFLYFKIEYAVGALRQSDLSVKEISHRLGFRSPYHFSKVFRRFIGTPPSVYREHSSKSLRSS